MPQELTTIQEQRQEQQLTLQQRLSAQQVMVVRMLEMPLAQFEQKVEAEMDENPALEGESYNDDADTLRYDDGGSDADSPDADAEGDGMDGEDGGDAFDQQEQKQEREDELDKVLDSLDSDDRMESSNYDRSCNHDPDADQEERIWGNTESFYDSLMEQVREQDLTERQQMIIDYLIGSLDGDGLLRKDIGFLCDEIAIRCYIDVEEDEVERVITILQSFDPAGIGAQSLQECLQIQILRKKPTHVTKLMHQVISECYDLFTKKHWQKIIDKLQMDELLADEVFSEIRKLNPRPGAALGETMGRNTEQITPDFIIDCDDNGNVSFTINNGNVPQLHVSRDFEGMIEAYRQNPTSMTRRDKEALVYMQQNVNRARAYIDAIKQRQQTMSQTMHALIKLQKNYLQSGDETDLKPMILKDVADLTNLDISTISRVCSSKYAETPWGIISLKSLFTDRYDVGNGEEISTRRIKTALRELVDNEDKRHPLSDLKLATMLKEQGFPIARRTVAKYREQLAIPTSNLRK